MRKHFHLLFCCALLLSTNALAKTYQSEHFTIHSDLDPCYVQFVQANAEAYYKNLEGRYFQTGWQEPLIIYYSERQSETQQLLNEYGKNKAAYGHYETSIPAVYAHRLMNDGECSGWGTLFHKITYHFIQINYQDIPEWFKEGLACFLGERTRIIRGKLILEGPNPTGEQISMDKIEKDVGENIKRLFSTEQLHNWDVGYHFARILFYWLYESGQLQEYLMNVQKKGYEFSVLKETVSKPYGTIKAELSEFIKKNCYAEVYLKDGQRTEDEIQKKQAFLKALELKPGYHTAQLELAKCYYHSKDYEKCRENLKQILNDPESIEYRRAARLMGDTYYYNEKDYPKALEYYNKAWEYSDYYEYKYRAAYQIANCHYYLKDPKSTKQWYEKFLDSKWEPESMKPQADYARKYLERTVEKQTKQHKCKENIDDNNEK